MKYESEDVEFKEMFTDKIYREVIAFTNTGGGEIYVGIDKDGNIVGIDDVDDTFTRITNGIRDSILPDVTMFIRYELQDEKIIKITVSEGSFKPYYLKGKGMIPSGVFVRQGASSAQASWEQIRQMIKLSDKESYEESRSLEQSLTFDTAQKEFEQRNIQFDQSKFTVLGITEQNSGLYTNLALLISDQCRHSIKAAVYSDLTMTSFRDHKEFTGSLFSQLHEVYEYLMLCNQTKSVISGLQRTDTKDYPDEAVREALLNAIIHRDYSFSGSIIINVNDSGMEFISIGGLAPGLSKEDILSGISQSRNKKLADMFYRLRHIEAYGTGIRRIFSLYEKHRLKPEIIITDNTFKVILPNINYYKNNTDENNEDSTLILSPQQKEILHYLKKNKVISEDKIQELLNVKRTRAYTITKDMIDKGFITVSGRGKEKAYIIAEDT